MIIQTYRTRDEYVDKFQIYAERNHGTNFLRESLTTAFDISNTSFYGHKHWLGFSPPERIQYARHTMFIGVVRNPYEWISALYNTLHHIPSPNRHRIEDFVKKEWYSVGKAGKEIMEDRNFTTDPPVRYKNICEMRTTKYRYLFEDMPRLARNYVLLRFEDFINHHTAVMNILRDRFQLIQTGKYLTADNMSSHQRKLNRELVPFVNDNLDWSLENTLGYAKIN